MHFIAEAQATSQLEHPGIPPVHDIGLTDDGRLYFTMKLIQGRTLREVLRDLLLKRRDVHREYTAHRLVGILQRVCEPIHFGHEKGVIHRDLKPENIMLGDYGEVHVVDWGLAHVEQSTEELPELSGVETVRRDAGLETEFGAIKGTVPYMSPEQLRGETLDRRTDVYALGCLLYEILSLHMAFDPGDSAVIQKKLQGEFEDVRMRNPRRDVPEALAVICEKALALAREDRYATADEMSIDLRQWLDGRAESNRKRLEAARLAEEGRAAAETYFELREDVRLADRYLKYATGICLPHEPISQNRTLVDSRDRAETARIDLALAFAECQKLLDSALLLDPSQAEARSELARLWRDRIDDAELRRESAEAAYAIAMLDRYTEQPAKHEGRLVLHSDPSADVTIARLEPEDGVLVAVNPRSLGPTPINASLLAGSYLCTLHAEGHPDVFYPVKISRDRSWGAAIEIPTADDIGDGFVFVPAGPFLYGEGRSAKRMTLPDFAIQKTPVSFADYIEFLRSLDADEADRRCPGASVTGAYLERDQSGWRFRADIPFTLDLPVVGIDYKDAEAYCRWKTSSTGREWRLPTEEEREKAARGVDGRRFAWGDFEHASLGKCRDSRAEQASLERSGSFPTATSVYGMVDASGGVWDWTSSWEDAHETTKIARGGSWFSPIDVLRCAIRISNPPDTRRSNIGFRCARRVARSPEGSSGTTASTGFG